MMILRTISIWVDKKMTPNITPSSHLNYLIKEIGKKEKEKKEKERMLLFFLTPPFFFLKKK
jgi:hypothetical protein